MVSTKSQMKQIRIGEKACLHNQSAKSELKTFVRKTHEAMVTGDKITAEPVLYVATRKPGVAVSKGIIHKNQAAQRKSKLATSVVTMN